MFVIHSMSITLAETKLNDEQILLKSMTYLYNFFVKTIDLNPKSCIIQPIRLYRTTLNTNKTKPNDDRT